MSVIPRGIVADRARGEISIEWDDDHNSVYGSRLLRWACPCAECKGEWGRPGRLTDLEELAEDEVTLVDVEAVGSYAILPVWASGHRQGIFSFEYLRSMCPCSKCQPS